MSSGIQLKFDQCRSMGKKFMPPFHLIPPSKKINVHQSKTWTQKVYYLIPSKDNVKSALTSKVFSVVALAGLSVLCPEIAGFFIIQMGIGLVASQLTTGLLSKEAVYIVKAADGHEYKLTAEQYTLLCSVILEKNAAAAEEQEEGEDAFVWVHSETPPHLMLQIMPEDVEALKTILEKTAIVHALQPPALHYMPFASISDRELKGLFQKNDLDHQLAHQRDHVRLLLKHA